MKLIPWYLYSYSQQYRQSPCFIMVYSLYDSHYQYRTTLNSFNVVWHDSWWCKTCAVLWHDSCKVGLLILITILKMNKKLRWYWYSFSISYWDSNDIGIENHSQNETTIMETSLCELSLLSLILIIILITKITWHPSCICNICTNAYWFWKSFSF